MPFSHHSHSGQFCMHAKDSLEDIIRTAISRNMRVFALTEHMPREREIDLYPEEKEAGQTIFDLWLTFKDYYNHALRLRSKYSAYISLPIAFEAEYIRPSSLQLIASLLDGYKFDFFIGSVHHVNCIPIDFDKKMYGQALESMKRPEELAVEVGRDVLETRLFEEYFDLQYEMLKELKPAIVGHFDLVRLMANDHEKPLKQYGGKVWEKVDRNLKFVASYKGCLELNGASLRKGWNTPYPAVDVCEAFISLSGRFVLSDDCHNATQVGLNYHRILDYITNVLKLPQIYYLERLPPGEIAVDVLGPCAVRTVSVDRLWNDYADFWMSLDKSVDDLRREGQGVWGLPTEGDLGTHGGGHCLGAQQKKANIMSSLGGLGIGGRFVPGHVEEICEGENGQNGM